MSTAHRPTWDPAQGKEIKGGSRQYSARDIASQTKLKFRQPGQSSTGEVSKRDLRAELLAAEAEAREKKRKAEGKPAAETPAAVVDVVMDGSGASDNEASKRRKLLQEALEMDKDDDDDDGSESEAENGKGKGKEKAVDEDSDSDDDEDDEDDDAELLRELEKIRRERAEEKARMEQEKNATSALAREEEIATSNPLLNLAAALGQTPGGTSVTSSASTFAVKRRWDDDLIFKNQAMGSNDKPSGQFVNDLLRTEFHRKFMSKFIK
ncbi:hypothetical protein FRC03_011078 [Tulasnella sp. 419]|nr:hypothetical protein FRC03_011078 [Tulasnella sp. 419]